VIARRLLVLAALLASTSSLASGPRINLEVDATDVAHGIQHVRLVLPAHPGPVTLAYPKWIPGEHRPTGPITQLMNLHIEAQGHDLPWRRDARDAFLFHLTVPPQTRALAVRFDFFSPPVSFGPGFGETPDATAHLLVLAFNQLIVYPADASADAVEVSTRVRIPAGWQVDSALPLERVSGDEVSLPVVSLYTLVDSPLLAGEYFRTIPLGGGPAAVQMSIAADRPGDQPWQGRRPRDPEGGSLE
jgi:predicted metalloprotease with PDZ domain